MLYLIPTPIGNLEDITIRAIKTLSNVQLILAEDTRNSGKLLKHLDISTKMRSYHAHNEHAMSPQIIEMLKDGMDIGLISDAGTPGISDPGFLLVRACYENDIPVTCLPGASAIIPALAMSGIPCNRFYFEGFLPHKKGRHTRWKALAELNCTIVLYESPHRIKKLISEAKEYLSEDRMVAIIKEISKIHESVYRNSLSELDIDTLGNKLKGEFVVIIGN